ncbi:MAG: helical backbone metal receptor [Thermoanaerobaculia bacterium]
MTGFRLRSGLVLLLLFAACGRQAAEERTGPQRIAVMAPAAAETLDALGIADRIVAVGDFVEVPGGRSLPRLGSYDLPNAERLVELRVDLLLTAASEAGRSEHARLAALGIRVVPLDTSTYAGTLAAMREIGSETGREREAEALLRSIAERVASVRERVANSGRPRVLVVVGREPLFVAGPGSHLDELIRIAGGENVAGDALGAYPMVSLEAMLERRPERILDSADNRSTGPFGAVAGDWERWPFLPAVRDRRVFVIEPSRLLVPGPRLGEMAERMGRFVHPEIFGEPAASDFAPPAAGEEE